MDEKRRQKEILADDHCTFCLGRSKQCCVHTRKPGAGLIAFANPRSSVPESHVLKLFVFTPDFQLNNLRPSSDDLGFSGTHDVYVHELFIYTSLSSLHFDHSTDVVWSKNNIIRHTHYSCSKGLM